MKLASDLSNLHHKNLLNFTEPVKIEKSHVPEGLMIFKTEAPDHRTLWKTMSKHEFDLEQLLSIFRQLTVGVEHMHSKDIIFRDFHPTRIHMLDGIIKWNLIGMPYNLFKLFKGTAFTGHLNYTAPELLRDR